MVTTDCAPLFTVTTAGIGNANINIDSASEMGESANMDYMDFYFTLGNQRCDFVFFCVACL